MKKALFIFFTAISIASVSAQTKAAGVTLPNTVSFEGEKLVLNGVGVREKFWMDMYAGALYVQSKSTSGEKIMAANEPMAIKIHIVSKLISSDKMIDAVNEGFQSSTKGNTSAFDSEIEKFKSFFKEEITKDDVFDIVYLPQEGVTVYKNGTKKGDVQGLEFKKALFGIWLSKNPADEKLKNGMLKG